MSREAAEFFESQLRLLDQVVSEGSHGASREEVLRNVLLEHVGDRLAGAPPYLAGAKYDDALEAEYPTYGASRFDTTLQPVSGKAIPLSRGEVLRIEQLVGGQCVDFNAFNLHDHKEYLDCGFTRCYQSFDPRRGEFVWSSSPRSRPMFVILEIAETCDLDLAGHRCNRVQQELGWGITNHPNCQDTLADAIREYGLTPDDVHDSFNLWMSTAIDEASGRRQFKWNPARKGDRIDFLAMFDVLAVVATCGIGDLVGTNNYTFNPVQVQVFERTNETSRLVDDVEQKWGRLTTQKHPADFLDLPIQSSRELRADPDYRANFIPLPATSIVELELTDTEQRLVDGLMESGVYGTSRGEAIRAAFMRWCNSTVTPFPLAKVVF